MKTYNRTDVTLAEIQANPWIMQVECQWRQRHIDLYECDNEHVYTVGITFDKTMAVICCERRHDWAREIGSGKKYYVRL
jgi:hypothetical protein